MDHAAWDGPGRVPERAQAEPMTAGTRCLLVIELAVVAVVAVLAVWSHAERVFRFGAAR